MDHEIIDRWNERVGDDDIVYHLGDWGNPLMIDRLRGKEIRLIKGNHDTKDIIDGLRCDKRFSMGKMNDFFSNGQGLFKMVHKPSLAKNSNLFYLFGHIHDKLRRVNGLNVGVDCHDFAPVSFDEVLWWKAMIVSKGRAWGELLGGNSEENYVS
jgi:calcineurin-like phosphoesterase family protein